MKTWAVTLWALALFALGMILLLTERPAKAQGPCAPLPDLISAFRRNSASSW
jgi:hypothetical protein